MRIDAFRPHAPGQSPRKKFVKRIRVESEAVHAGIDFDMTGNANTVLLADAPEKPVILRIGNGENQAVSRAAHDVIFAERRAQHEYILPHARMAQLCAFLHECHGEHIRHAGQRLRDRNRAVTVCIRLDDSAELCTLRAG